MFGFLQATSVNVGNRDGLAIGRTERVLENVQSAPAGPDQPEPDAVISAEDTRRRKNRRTCERGRTSANLMNKPSAIEHDCNSFG